ncbi:MAG: tetratricopeptide repeat protein, partial [Rudaea sp.]
VDSVHNVQPEKQRGPATLAALFDYMGKHAKARLASDPKALARMWLVIGQGVSEFGEPARGLAIAKRGLDLLRRTDPQALEDRASALSKLAILHKRADDLAGAEAAARESIALFQSRPPSRDRSLEIIRVRTLLGNLLTESGQWHKAVAAHRQILIDRAQLLGNDSPALAVDYYNLAHVLRRLNRTAEAYAAYSRAAKLVTATDSAAPSVHALFVQQGLAGCELDLGRLERARKMFLDIRQGYLHHYPPGHRTVLNVSVQLAEIERRSGHAQEALRMLRALPDKIFDTINARLSLVHALIDNSRYDDARAATLPLQAQMQRAHDPRAAYLPALSAWLDYRAGGNATPARRAIDGALRVMRAAGYGELRETNELARWHDALAASGSNGQR